MAIVMIVEKKWMVHIAQHACKIKVCLTYTHHVGIRRISVHCITTSIPANCICLKLPCIS